ncbi:sigma factor-like helix-turn-helix DNA-binding protein [Nocardia brevicatena]|uniref:sigma factor-like helix-turn-helix DNA-binding protein n=1 Tax=Nocardia brevicatena TaxID=37327 RepID=UPI000A0267F1
MVDRSHALLLSVRTRPTIGGRDRPECTGPPARGGEGGPSVVRVTVSGPGPGRAPAGVSRERIRQIEAKAMAKLRKPAGMRPLTELLTWAIGAARPGRGPRIDDRVHVVAARSGVAFPTRIDRWRRPLPCGDRHSRAP